MGVAKKKAKRPARKPKLMCHCGQPLHYESQMTQAFVQDICDVVGPNQHLLYQGVMYAVPRHYIALHGYPKGDDIPKLNFKVVA